MAKGKKITIEICTKDTLLKYNSSSNHQGVIIILPGDNTPKAKKDELLLNVSKEKGVLVILDRLTDPHNIGSIIRSAEALGARGVIMPRANSPRITGTIAKCSAGATAHIPILFISNIAQFLEEAKKYGFWIIGTSEHGNIDLSKIASTKPAIIVIGNEGSGIKKLTEQKCDYTVKIPLKGKIESLNASVAAGIILYEILK